MSRLRYGVIVDVDGNAVFPRAVQPVGFVARLRGLIARPPLHRGQAWWFERCNSVHTFGMRVSIDILHLDRDGRILCVRPNLRPGRCSLHLSGATVIELGGGVAASTGLQPGKQLRFLA